MTEVDRVKEHSKEWVLLRGRRTGREAMQKLKTSPLWNWKILMKTGLHNLVLNQKKTRGLKVQTLLSPASPHLMGHTGHSYKHRIGALLARPSRLRNFPKKLVHVWDFADYTYGLCCISFFFKNTTFQKLRTILSFSTLPKTEYGLEVCELWLVGHSAYCMVL